MLTKVNRIAARRIETAALLCYTHGIPTIEAIQQAGLPTSYQTDAATNKYVYLKAKANSIGTQIRDLIEEREKLLEEAGNIWNEHIAPIYDPKEE